MEYVVEENVFQQQVTDDDLPPLPPSPPPPPTPQLPPPGGKPIPHTSRVGPTAALLVLAVAVLLAFLATVLLISAHEKATYYKPVCLTHSLGQQSLSYMLSNVSCEELSPGTYDNCRYLQRQPGPRPECPSKWLFNPCMYFVALACAFSVAIFIAVALFPGRAFKLGVVATMGVALVLTVSAACVMAFFIWLRNSSAWCDPGKMKRDYEHATTNPSSSQLGLNFQEHRLSAGDMQWDKLCRDVNTLTFQPWLLVAGAVLSGLAAVVYVMAAVMLMMAGRKGQRPQQQPQGKQFPPQQQWQ